MIAMRRVRQLNIEHEALGWKGDCQQHRLTDNKELQSIIQTNNDVLEQLEAKIEKLLHAKRYHPVLIPNHKIQHLTFQQLPRKAATKSLKSHHSVGTPTDNLNDSGCFSHTSCQDPFSADDEYHTAASSSRIADSILQGRGDDAIDFMEERINQLFMEGNRVRVMNISRQLQIAPQKLQGDNMVGSSVPVIISIMLILLSVLLLVTLVWKIFNHSTN